MAICIFLWSILPQTYIRKHSVQMVHQVGIKLRSSGRNLGTAVANFWKFSLEGCSPPLFTFVDNRTVCTFKICSARSPFVLLLFSCFYILYLLTFPQITTTSYLWNCTRSLWSVPLQRRRWTKKFLSPLWTTWSYQEVTTKFTCFLFQIFFIVWFYNNPCIFFLSISVNESSESMSNFAIFLIVFFSLLGLVFAGVILLIVYNKWQERSRKHFYWACGTETRSFARTYRQKSVRRVILWMNQIVIL